MKWPAASRCGTAGAIAFQTRSAAKIIESQYVETGAGRLAVKTVPSGQTTFIGRKQPSFAGMWGSVSALKTMRTAELSPVQEQLTGPGTCGEVPVKSVMNSPSRTVTVTLQ